MEKILCLFSAEQSKYHLPCSSERKLMCREKDLFRDAAESAEPAVQPALPLHHVLCSAPSLPPPCLGDCLHRLWYQLIIQRFYVSLSSLVGQGSLPLCGINVGSQCISFLICDTDAKFCWTAPFSSCASFLRLETSTRDYLLQNTEWFWAWLYCCGHLPAWCSPTPRTAQWNKSHVFCVGWSCGQNDHIVHMPHRKHFVAPQLDCGLSYTDGAICVPKGLWDSFVLSCLEKAQEYANCDVSNISEINVLKTLLKY